MPLRGKICSVGLAGALLLAGCGANRAVMNGNPEDPYPPKGGPKVGEIYHLPTGLAISEDGLMDMLSGARLVSVGETHDNLERPESRADRRARAPSSLPGEDRRRDGDVPGTAAGGSRQVGEGRAHGARIPESLEMVRDVGVRLRCLPGPAPLREGEPDRPDRPESVEGAAGGGSPDWAGQRSGGPSPYAAGDRRDRSLAAPRPAQSFSLGIRGTATGTHRSTPSSASSFSGRSRWPRRWSII